MTQFAHIHAAKWLDEIERHEREQDHTFTLSKGQYTWLDNEPVTRDERLVAS